MSNDNLDCCYIVKMYHPRTGDYLGKYALTFTEIVGIDKIAEDANDCKCNDREDIK